MHACQTSFRRIVNQSFNIYKVHKCSVDREVERGSGQSNTFDPPAVPVPTEADLEYFDVLLGAVTARLGSAADDVHGGTIALRPEQALQRLRTTVLECVEALQQLQATHLYAQGLREPQIK